MKTNKLKKKLFLNKATVVHLDKPGMKVLKGGSLPSREVVVSSCLGSCFEKSCEPWETVQ